MKTLKRLMLATLLVGVSNLACAAEITVSADQETMDAAEKQGLVMASDRHDFVRNALVLIEPQPTVKSQSNDSTI